MFVPLSNPRNWPCPLTSPVGLGLEDETSAECAAHKNEGAQDRALSSPVLFLCGWAGQSCVILGLAWSQWELLKAIPHWQGGLCPSQHGDTASSVWTRPPQRLGWRSSGSPGSLSNRWCNWDLKGSLLLVLLELKPHCVRCAAMPQLCARLAWNMTVNKMKYELYWSCLHRVIIHTECNSPLGTGQTLELGKTFQMNVLFVEKKKMWFWVSWKHLWIHVAFVKVFQRFKENKTFFRKSKHLLLMFIKYNIYIF